MFFSFNSLRTVLFKLIRKKHLYHLMKMILPYNSNQEWLIYDILNRYTYIPLEIREMK